MAPYMMVMIAMILVWDVTQCVARPADVNQWTEVSDYGRRTEDELNAIDHEPTGLYKGKATGKSDWKAVFRLSEIVRLSKKLEQVLQKEAEAIAAEPAPDEQVPVSGQRASSVVSPPIYGPEKIVDQLHEQTGEKQRFVHSALDGWIF